MTPDARIFIPLDQALELYPCPGITPELVEYIARYHGVLMYAERSPQELLVDQEQYKLLIQDLKNTRKNAQGYIRIKDATGDFGFSLRTLYKLIDQGYIRKGKKRGELLHEDVAFFARLSNIVQLPMGKALLPLSYDPKYQQS